jgi:hypothetical protein
MELLAVAATADDVGAAYDLGAYLQRMFHSEEPP